MADGTFNAIKPQLESLEKFIYSDDISAILETALATNKNIILFGAGGHGKSQMVETALKQFKPFIQAFGEGMTEERLFGGLEMKLFQEKGEIRYKLENSFMAHEIVVFEEFFDAPSNILLSVKDILTSKQFRNGSQNEQIKTKIVIALTNRTPEEVGEDLSTKALLERFPLKLEVEWKHYTAMDYQKLFKKVLKTDELIYLAEIFEEIYQNGGFISPRTAIHAGDVALKCGISALKFIDGIDSEIFRRLEKMKKQSEKDAQEDKIIDQLKIEVDQLTDRFQNATTPLEFLQVKKSAEFKMEHLANLSVKEQNLSKLNSLLGRVLTVIRKSDENSKRLLQS